MTSPLIHRQEVEVPEDNEKAVKLFWHMRNSEPYNLGSATGTTSEMKNRTSQKCHKSALFQNITYL